MFMCSLKRDIQDEGQGQGHGEYETFCLSSFVFSVHFMCLGLFRRHQ